MRLWFCRYDGTRMVEGKSLIDVYGVGARDLPSSKRGDRGQTMVPTGEARVMKCMKCPKCGHSISFET